MSGWALKRMKTAILNAVVLGIMLLAGALAQSPSQPLKPVTVCEVLKLPETAMVRLEVLASAM